MEGYWIKARLLHHQTIDSEVRSIKGTYAIVSTKLFSPGQKRAFGLVANELP
jgi:hypothetical protein